MSQLSLTVWRLDQTCKFILDWGQGCQLPAELPLSSSLLRYFEVWQQAYLDYYRSGLRAKLKQSGSFKNPATDWRSRLAQAEANLTTEFHRWLSAAELNEIREQITAIVIGAQKKQHSQLSLSLRCDDLELARLPWESWEISQSVRAAGLVRLSRAPGKIKEAVTTYRRQGKMRLLAIIGDDTGLSFKEDLEALQSLKSLIDIELVGWKAGKEIPALRAEICQAIADQKGWDVLFFAGHSNETNMTGGELAIAPGKAILLSEIAPQLALAKAHGLKFALFNSCKGLSIATNLIEQGLSHVAVMREPIRNDVAQAFLGAFVKALGRYENVHQAMYSASQDLKVNYKLAFPSAYLVPSLFQHPSAVPFKLEPVNFKACLKRWIPTKAEAIALGTVALLSLMPGLQRQLIEQRLLFQGQYRGITGQLTKPVIIEPPPVLLVEIDNQSISQGNITDVRPTFSRQYLGKLVEKADELGVETLGLDYVLDRPSKTGDPLLKSALLEAEQDGMRIIFATLQEDGQWLKPHPNVAPFRSDQLGDINLLGNQDSAVLHMKRDVSLSKTETIFPFSQKLAKLKPSNSPALKEVQTNWVTQFSYHLGQTWLHPLLDYSIPPAQVYERLLAWQWLEESAELPVFQDASQPVVLIVAGYDDAGSMKDGDDSKLAPRVIRYWWKAPSRKYMSGGEVHAYHIHHLEKDAWVVPLPDFWWVGMGALMGKWGRLASWNGLSRRDRIVWISIGLLFYGVATLQIYITFQVLLPWLLPTAAIYSYALMSKRQTFEQHQQIEELGLNS